MDVDELLAYKTGIANPSLKRGPTDDDKSRQANKRKLVEIEKEKILKIVEEETDVEQVDELSIKKLLLKFEKRVYKNQEMRIKFPDNPEKFMESEVQLHDVIQEMHVVTTLPDCYQSLVELNTVQSALQLLAHENTDVSIAIVDLLYEMTDVSTLSENDEAAEALVDALLEGQLIATLLQNLDRLDENVKEEADGVHNTLGIMENLTEYKPEICLEATQQGLMSWLLKRLKVKIPFDANKLYASEILAILVQNHTENRELLGETEGIDILLQQLASYKRHDPITREELEMMENLFNCLCSALMVPANRGRFLKGEGLQLMNLMLREKKMSRNTALKVLDHAMTGDEGKECAQKFVDILGLRSVFPLFMKTPKKARGGPGPREMEEHTVSILCSLLKSCQQTQRQRLINKFTENDHEKVERLLELHFKYLERVRRIDQQIEKEKSYQLLEEEEDADQEGENYMKRLDAGLFTLQLIDFIMLEICANGPTTIKQRVTQIINLRGGSIKSIKSIMREYAGNIGDDKDSESKEVEQDRILSLVEKF